TPPGCGRSRPPAGQLLAGGGVGDGGSRAGAGQDGGAGRVAGGSHGLRRAHRPNLRCAGFLRCSPAAVRAPPSQNRWRPVVPKKGRLSARCQKGEDEMRAALLSAVIAIVLLVGALTYGRALLRPMEPASVRELTVEGFEYGFDPGEITLSRGDTVRVVFRNTGTIEHDVTIPDLDAAP